MTGAQQQNRGRTSRTGGAPAEQGAQQQNRGRNSRIGVQQQDRGHNDRTEGGNDRTCSTTEDRYSWKQYWMTLLFCIYTTRQL